MVLLSRKSARPILFFIHFVPDVKEVKMAEVQKIRCSGCSRICPAVQISLETIRYTFSNKNLKPEQNALGKAFLLKSIMVICQKDGKIYFVKM